MNHYSASYEILLAQCLRGNSTIRQKGGFDFLPLLTWAFDNLPLPTLQLIFCTFYLGLRGFASYRWGPHEIPKLPMSSIDQANRQALPVCSFPISLVTCHGERIQSWRPWSRWPTRPGARSTSQHHSPPVRPRYDASGSIRRR